MKNRKAAVRFIFVTILLDAIGLGLLIPVLPDVLRRFSSDPSVVSERFGWFIGVYALGALAAVPGLVFVLTGGAVWGIFWGTLYNTVGANLGANLAFLLARLLGREFVEGLLHKGRLQTLDARAAE